ncbi:2-succinyl-6-hydroxy-2,4-cyclohexadiene-1-carboxylate synthase [Ectothiorhodospira magna]|nr:2-succinyl-6-hydroxy-2,4-cyclohexadiene-1-carboxylate synthase [Ectothiorhodospira magna]
MRNKAPAPSSWHQRPVLVLLHGFMGSGDDWASTAQYLSDQYHCLRPDLPGHGGQPLPPRLTFTDYCHWCWQQLAPQLPPRFILAGYSMGGRIAARLAIEHPERIAALILEGAHPGLETRWARRTRRQQDALWVKRFTQDPWPAVLADWYQQPVFADLTPQRRADFIRVRSRQDPTALAQVLQAAGLGRQPNLRPGLARLSCPCVFIAGSRDTKFTALGQDLTRTCPRFELVKLDGLGHNCHAQAPHRVAAVIRRHDCPGLFSTSMNP